jgi:membrane protease YdiL (CAAX protease family)
MNQNNAYPTKITGMDWKGIASFLLITFGLTYAIEITLILSGFRWEGIPPIIGQYVVAAVMWVPALATVLTIKLVTREGFAITNLRFGSFKPYLYAALGLPLVFATIYGLTWLLGLGHPDWGLESLRQMMASAGADLSTMPPASTLLLAVFFSSLSVGPTINGIFGFGEEFGWRGYLLPKLIVLGKVRAYTVLGIIWGLWHAPLILAGFNYPGYPVLGVIWMCGLTTALGILINELTLRYRSSILAGSIHGAFNGQSYGVWRILFPDTNPLLGGITGLVGILVLLGLGLWVARRSLPYPVDNTASLQA